MGVLAASQERSVKLRSAVGAVEKRRWRKLRKFRGCFAAVEKVLSPLRYESVASRRAESALLAMKTHTDLYDLNRYSSYAAVQKALCAVQSSISLRPFKESINFL